MSESKKILLIEPFTALPQTSGGKTRILHTIKELHKYFDVTVWSFIFNPEEKKTQQQWLVQLNVAAKYFRAAQKRMGSFFLWKQPYWFSDWYSLELIAAIGKEAKNFEIIQVEFTQLLYLVDYLPVASKKIFVAHDISTLSFWRRLRNETNYLKKLAHFWRLVEIYLYERWYLPKYDQVIAVSKLDAQILQKYFKLQNVSVLPNGIAQVKILPPRKQQNGIVLGYIGSFAHAPNLEAVRFIIQHILPALDQQQIRYQLHLAGENDWRIVQQLIQNSSLLDGSTIKQVTQVVEVKDFYQQIDLLVAPIFAGSGTRIKILESLSFGRPVLTTTIGAEGIELETELLRVLKESEETSSAAWIKEILLTNKLLRDGDFDSEKLTKQLQKMTWGKIISDFCNF